MAKPKKAPKKTSKPKSKGRRSRAESMTGAKDNEVEVRSAIGHNSEMALIEPDDWNHHKKSIRGWREKVTTAQSGLRNACKLAKKAGVNMDSLNMVVGIERQNDPVKTMQFFQQIDLGLSLSEETHIRITPHDGLAGEVSAQAYKRGFADGEGGKTANSRYPEGSDLAREYQRGWMHGTGKNMGQSPEEVDAALGEEPEKIAAE